MQPVQEKQLNKLTTLAKFDTQESECQVDDYLQSHS